MKLPQIDLSSLPDLDTVTGLFGSLSHHATAATDDRLIVIMVYIYETMPTIPGA